tara:strand:- start:4202 stop:5797 length:1596 start_codon:yes stop_codon:yes gene_type:complete
MEKDGYLWSVPVLDGFSFSQATNSSEITLNEMEDSSGRSRRGRKMFTDSLSAAEWSFSTYIRPFKSAGSKSATNGRADSTNTHQHAVEEALWVAMAGQNVYVPSTGKWKHGATGGAITSVTVASGGTDNDSGDRAAGTYNIAVPTVGADANLSAAVASGTGSNTGGTGAVIQVVVNGSGVATATITERGTGFDTGNTITIGSQLLGGDASGDSLVLTTSSSSAVSDATDLNINFFDSNRAALGTFNLYFVFSDRSAGRLLYKLSNAVVNEAAIDFDIDGIATVNWSGMAGQIKEVGTGLGAGQLTAAASFPNPSAVGALWIDTDDSDKLYISTSTTNAAASWSANVSEGSTNTGNFIRNRLTNLTLAPETAFQAGTTFDREGTGTADDNYRTSYQVAITGGNVTISNNISYLTPEELGKVNQPIEHVTGTRTVTGSLTCYLASSDAATNKSKNLFQDLVSDINTVINKFAITLQVGGTDATKPRFEINMPTAHFEIPSHSIEDVISLETNFHGLGTSVGEGDEVSLKYIGV